MTENNLPKGLLELSTGIPKPIQEGFFKAIGHLGSACLQNISARIDRSTAETNAYSQVAQNMILAVGKSMTEKIDVDPNYAIIAQEKHARKIIRERINIDKILLGAKEALEKRTYSPVKTDEKYIISEDWLNAFGEKAKLMSSEGMQTYFSAILAGEINKPGSFSIRTVNLISELSQKEGESFSLLSQLFSVVTFYPRDTNEQTSHDTALFTLNEGLKKYGLYYLKLANLVEAGLINTTGEESMNISGKYFRKVNIQYGNGSYTRPLDLAHHLTFSQIILTQSGKELLPIASMNNPNKLLEYKEDLEQYLLKLSFKKGQH